MSPTVKKIVQRLKEANPNEQIKLIKSIADMRLQEAVPELLQLLQNKVDYDVQIETIKALGIIQDVQAGDTLLRYLSQEDIPILMETVLALGKLCEIGFSKSLQPLEDMLDHPNYRVRKFTIEALASCGRESTLERLFLILQQENLSEEMREQITLAIGRIGGSRAIEILQQLLIPSDLFPKLSMEVRRAAILALGENKTPVALELLGKIYQDKSEPKIIRKYSEDAIKKTILGAKEYFLRIKEQAERILKRK
ncbi:MAG: HEAT repeat domain-containing protein [Candidatus Lokiarchaeota archaeon]|nr:HEAT repeat domain-containing protein [Candidatus Harpocratesius repetitus]